jgi:hypothetical protein
VIRKGDDLAVSSEHEVETALINLIFAEAELKSPGVSFGGIRRALEHIRPAIASLERLAVDFGQPPAHRGDEPESAEG